MMDLYSAARPFLFRLEPERAHRLSLWALRSGLIRGGAAGCARPELAQTVFGLRFPNPVGLAAGYDKNGDVPDSMARLGFGFIEVGTVTPNPQAGNSQPRIFRLIDDAALINRLGFNNGGLARMRANLARRRGRGIVGANLGANRDSPDRAGDYVDCLKSLYAVADYFTINVSSPNTPGLRGLQQGGALDELLGRLLSARTMLASGMPPKPLLLKVAPDLEEVEREAVATTVLAHGIEGLIVGNTTLARNGLRSPLATEAGGLSGRPLFEQSTAVLAHFYRLTEGRLPLIGVGGIASGADAYRKIRAGASLVQLYTALVYRGPGLPARIVAELVDCLREDGLSRIGDAIGLDSR